ncbi:MAG TPA: ABC transporter ATP-binding protein [Puia sp.]|jgi:NitT/TauT family transport system ATP-binding protein
MAIIQLENVQVQFVDKGRKFIAVQDCSLSVDENEFVAIVGQSGCGKTTLLNLVAGFLQPSSGKLFFADEEIQKPGPDRVVVFQEDAVFPWMTVGKNIAYGLAAKGLSAEQQEPIVSKYLQLVGLTGFRNYYPKNLSGGMKKRVDLARAYAINPKVFLMDEPFGALDSYTRQNMQTELLHLWNADKKTVLFVTHDVSEAIYMADRIVLMSPRPGKIEQVFMVPFPRPRQKTIRKSPAFLELQSEIEGWLDHFEDK